MGILGTYEKIHLQMQVFMGKSIGLKWIKYCIGKNNGTLFYKYKFIPGNIIEHKWKVLHCWRVTPTFFLAIVYARYIYTVRNVRNTSWEYFSKLPPCDGHNQTAHCHSKKERNQYDETSIHPWSVVSCWCLKDANLEQRKIGWNKNELNNIWDHYPY